MKKVVYLIICIVFTLLLHACGGNTSDNQDEPEIENTANQASTPSDLHEKPTSTPQKVENGEISVVWEPDYSKFAIEESNAIIALRATVNGLNPSQISSYGVDLYDSNYNPLTSRREPATFSDSDNSINIWYDVSSDLNYTLSGNTKYIFTMYVVINGTTYTSERYSFTTRGDDTQDLNEGSSFATPEPTPVPPEPTASYMPLLRGMEQNGTYKLTLYEEGKQETSGGTIVSADLMMPSTVTDEEARNILAIDPDASYSNNGNYEEITYYGGFLTRAAGEKLWQKRFPSDALELEVFSSGQIFIPYDAQFFDNMTSIMLGTIRSVSSLDELFHVSFMGSEFSYSSIEVQVTVSDGVITTVDMYYTP